MDAACVDAGGALVAGGNLGTAGHAGQRVAAQGSAGNLDAELFARMDTQGSGPEGDLDWHELSGGQELLHGVREEGLAGSGARLVQLAVRDTDPALRPRVADHRGQFTVVFHG